MQRTRIARMQRTNGRSAGLTIIALPLLLATPVALPGHSYYSRRAPCALQFKNCSKKGIKKAWYRCRHCLQQVSCLLRRKP